MNIGFIGCGAMASYHADAFVALAARVHAVCGRPGSTRAREFAAHYGATHVCDSADELLERKDLDAICVAPSWDVTGTLLPDIVASGIPALVEKPAALDSVSLSRAKTAAARRSAHVRIAMNRRYYSFMPELRRFIAEYPPRAVEIVVPEAYPGTTGDRHRLRHLWVISSIHEIDLVSHLVGDLRLVAVQRHVDPELGVTVNTNALLAARSTETAVHLSANWGSSDRKTIRFVSAEPVALLSPIELLRIYHGIDHVPAGGRRRIAVFRPRLVVRRRAASAFKPGVYEQAGDFLAELRDGRERHLGRLEQAETVTRLIETLQGMAACADCGSEMHAETIE